MFMLGLGPIAVLHNRIDTSFSAREIASDYWCRLIIDRLLYMGKHIFIYLIPHTCTHRYDTTLADTSVALANRWSSLTEVSILLV